LEGFTERRELSDECGASKNVVGGEGLLRRIIRIFELGFHSLLALLVVNDIS